MIFLLFLIIILVIVIPPAGLILAGIFLYSLGSKMEKEQKKDIKITRRIKMNEYSNQILEQMK